MPPKKPTYQKLDQIDHIHKRPDMYLGSLKVRTYNDEWIFDRKVSRIKIKDSIRYSEGLLRIFVEALSKAGTVEEAKVIFETLQSTVSGTQKESPKTLSEAVSRKSTLLPQTKEAKNPADPRINRMRRLAGLN